MANNNNNTEDTVKKNQIYSGKVTKKDSKKLETVSLNYADAEDQDIARTGKVNINYDTNVRKDKSLGGAEQIDELAKQDKENMSSKGSADASPVNTSPHIDIQEKKGGGEGKGGEGKGGEGKGGEGKGGNEGKGGTVSNKGQSGTESVDAVVGKEGSEGANSEDGVKNNDDETEKNLTAAEKMLLKLKKEEKDTSIEEREKLKKKEAEENKAESGTAESTENAAAVKEVSDASNEQSDEEINTAKMTEEEKKKALDNSATEQTNIPTDDEDSSKKQEPAQTDADLEDEMEAKLVEQNKIKEEATEIGLITGRSIGYGMKLEKIGGEADAEKEGAGTKEKTDSAAADDTAGDAAEGGAADDAAAKKSDKKPYYEKTPFFTEEEFERGRQKEEQDKNKDIQPNTRAYFNFKKKFLKKKSDEYSVQKLKEAEQQDAQKPKFSVFYVQAFTAGYAQGQQLRRKEEADKRAAAEKEKEKDPNYKLGKLVGSQAGTKSVMGETEFDLTVDDVVYKGELSAVKTNALNGLDPNGKAMSEMFTEAYIKFFGAHYIKAQQLKKKGLSLEERLKEPFFKKGYEGGNRLQRAEDLTPEDKVSLEKSKLEYVEKGADAKAKQNPDYGKERAGFLFGYSAGHYQKKAEAEAAAKALQERKTKDPVFLLGQTAGKIHGMIAAVFGRAQVATMVSNSTALKEAGLLMQIPPHIEVLLQNGGEGASPDLFVSSSGASLLSNAASEKDAEKKAELQKRYKEQLAYYREAFRFNSNNSFLKTANNKGALEQNKKMNKPGYARAMKVVYQHEEKIDENDAKPIPLKLNLGGLVAYAEFKCEFLADTDAHKKALQAEIDKAYAVYEQEDADFKQGFDDTRNFYYSVVRNPKNPVGLKIRAKAFQQSRKGNDDNTKLCYSYGYEFGKYKKEKQDRLTKAKSLGIDISAVEQKDIKFVQKIKLDFKLEIVKMYYPQGIVVNKEDEFDSFGNIISYSQKFEEALAAALPAGKEDASGQNEQILAQITEGLRYFDNGYIAFYEASKPKVIEKGNDAKQQNKNAEEEVQNLSLSAEEKAEGLSLFKKGAEEGYNIAYNHVKDFVPKNKTYDESSLWEAINNLADEKLNKVIAQLEKGKFKSNAIQLSDLYDSGLNKKEDSEKNYGVSQGFKDAKFFAAGYFEAVVGDEKSAAELTKYKNPMHKAYAEGKSLGESSAGYDEFAEMMGSDATQAAAISDPDERAAYDKGLEQDAAAWQLYFANLYSLPFDNNSSLSFATHPPKAVDAKLLKNYASKPESLIDLLVDAYAQQQAAATNDTDTAAAKATVDRMSKQFRKGALVAMQDAESKLLEAEVVDFSPEEKQAYDQGKAQDDKALTAFFVLKNKLPLQADLKNCSISIEGKALKVDQNMLSAYSNKTNLFVQYAAEAYYKSVFSAELAQLKEASNKNKQDIDAAALEKKATLIAEKLRKAFEKGYTIALLGKEKEVLKAGKTNAQYSLGYLAAFVELQGENALPGQLVDLQSKLNGLDIALDENSAEYIEGYNKGLELAQMQAAGLVSEQDFDKQLAEGDKNQEQGAYSQGLQAGIKDATLHAKDPYSLSEIPNPQQAYDAANPSNKAADKPQKERLEMPANYRDSYLNIYWKTKDPLAGEIDGARSVVQGGSAEPSNLYTAVKNDFDAPEPGKRAIKDTNSYEIRFMTSRDRYLSDPDAAATLKKLEQVDKDPAKMSEDEQMDKFLAQKNNRNLEKVTQLSKNYAAYASVRDLGMQQQLQIGALQQHTAGVQEIQLLDKSLKGLSNQLAKEGLSSDKRLSLEKAQQDLKSKKASLVQQDTAMKSETGKNTVQGALYIEHKDTGFLSIEAGLARVQQYLANGGNNDLLIDYLELSVDEKEQKEADASDTKASASLSDAVLKSRLSDEQRQSIYDAFIQSFNIEKEVHYAQFVQQLQDDFGLGNKQNYLNVDMLLTDFGTPISTDNDTEAAVKIGEAIDQLETDRQDTGQVLLNNLSLIGLVEEQEGLLYDTAAQIEQHRIDIIDLIGQITAEEAYGSVERVLNNENAMRAELQELENKASEGPLDTADLERQEYLQSKLNSMQETNRRIESLKNQERSKEADIDYSIDDFRYFLNQYLKLNIGSDSNDKILDYVDHFEDQLQLDTDFNYSGQNLRFFGSGKYIVMPNAEDIKSDASIELFQDTFSLKGQGFEFKQAGSHITLLSGTAVIPTLQAGDSAKTADQYTFNNLALSLQSDLKSQIIEKSNRTIIGIALKESTGDRGYMADDTYLKKDGDHNFEDGFTDVIV